MICAKCGAVAPAKCGQVPALEKNDAVRLLVPRKRRPETLLTTKEIEDAIDENEVQFAACKCKHKGGDACAEGKCDCVNYSMKGKVWSRWYNIIAVNKEFRNRVKKARKPNNQMVASSSTAAPTNAHPEEVPCP